MIEKTTRIPDFDQMRGRPPEHFIDEHEQRLDWDEIFIINYIENIPCLIKDPILRKLKAKIILTHANLQQRWQEEADILSINIKLPGLSNPENPTAAINKATRPNPLMEELIQAQENANEQRRRNWKACITMDLMRGRIFNGMSSENHIFDRGK